MWNDRINVFLSRNIDWEDERRFIFIAKLNVTREYLMVSIGFCLLDTMHQSEEQANEVYDWLAR